MIVELMGSWFSPTEVVQVDKIRKMSGKHYKRGVHEDIPDELRDFLPSSAKILKDVPIVEEEIVEDDITKLDLERTASDAYIKVAEEAEKVVEDRRQEMKKKRQAAMAHARAAKANKKKE